MSESDPKFFVISDDLTGASGFSSIYANGAITVDYDRLSRVPLSQFDVISVNIMTREKPLSESVKKFENVLESIKGNFVTFRIDSSLRNNMDIYVKILSKLGDIVVTDTIPEYDRYTEDGVTFYDNTSTDLNFYFKDVKQEIVANGGGLAIMDSRSIGDIQKIATMCLANGIIPVDPGILIAEYIRMAKDK